MLRVDPLPPIAMILVAVAAVPPAVVPTLTELECVTTAPLVMMIWAKPFVVAALRVESPVFVVPPTL